MVRLRTVRAVRVLTFEERTRVASLFMLLVEIDLEKGVTRKRRAPKAAKAKTAQRKTRKAKQKPAEEHSHMFFM